MISTLRQLRSRRLPQRSIPGRSNKKRGLTRTKEGRNMAEWNDVIVMSPESPSTELINDSAGELAEVLHERPEAPADIRAVLERALGVQVGPESWEQARRALVDGLGAKPAGLLMWMSVQDQRDEDRARRLERLESTRK